MGRKGEGMGGASATDKNRCCTPEAACMFAVASRMSRPNCSNKSPTVAFL